MFTLDQPYNILVIFSVVIPSMLVVAVMRQRPSLGVRSFSVLMASVALWAFVALFEVYPQDQSTKIFSYKIKFLFIVIVPVAWLAFSLYYSNRVRQLPLKHLIMLLIVPVMTITMVATNSYHQWMFTNFEIVNIDAYRLLYPHFGPYFWVHVAYSYLLILTGVIFLAKPLIDSPAHYRRQVISLLVGGLTPWISNIFFILKIGYFTYFDLTPIAFTISGIAFMWGILRYRLLDIVPIAREVVIQHLNDGVIVIDNEENVVDLNQRARDLSGIDAIIVIGAQARRIFSWWPQLKHHETEARGSALPMIEMMADGRRQWIQLTRSPLMVKSRSIGQMVTLHDVTAIQQAEMALRDSEQRFKSLSENAPVIIFSLDENGALNYVNPAWESILGYRRSQVLGKPFVTFVGNDSDHNVAGVFDQLISGRMAVAEINIHVTHRNGSSRLFNTSAAANSDMDGRVTGIIGLAKDVTEECELQHQLFQSQKMEAVGTLAGGIAHDFNNLLMGMQANLSLIRLEADGRDTICDKVMRIEDQIHSGASLTRQLLGYARKGKYSVTEFDLNNLIESTLNVVYRTNKKIKVHNHASEPSVFIKADQGQMELVLLNLLINAVDAMPEGGDLTVTTKLIQNSDLTMEGSSPVMTPHVVLEVVDTGVGMDRATQDRIFEPFFTTKEIGRGTGLGLASVYGIVQNHKGRIQVRSRKGEGTAFTLMLPATRRTARSSASRPALKVKPAVSGKILLVDDEPLILKYCSEMIKSLGFTVLSTQDSREAVDLFKRHIDEIDLLVLDMIMPGIDGIQLFKTLEELNPQIRAILTTGYAVDDRIAKLIASGRHGCLRKPYGREDLSKIINTLLPQARMPGPSSDAPAAEQAGSPV